MASVQYPRRVPLEVGKWAPLEALFSVTSILSQRSWKILSPLAFLALWETR